VVAAQIAMADASRKRIVALFVKAMRNAG